MDIEVLFENMRQYASKNSVPIIEKEGLNTVLGILKENNIKTMLELGTAIGYSALSFSVQANCLVTTIEREEQMMKTAISNIKLANKEKEVELIYADALEVDETKLGLFDCIYIDAAKAQNQNFLNKFENNLNDDGIIIFDNLLFHGYVNSSDKYNKSKSFVQMMNKIEKFITYVNINPKYDFKLIENGDGIGVLKINKEYKDNMKKINITYHDYDTLKEILEANNEYISIVSVGSNQFGLRQEVNVQIEEMEKIVDLCNLYDIKVYVMVNKILHNKDLIKLQKYLRKLEKLKIAGVVFSDLAVYKIIKECDMSFELEYSTETTITNKYFSNFAFENNINTIELAKEITAKEVNEIVANKSSKIALYIHGHLYMYQSIRKTLTNFFDVQKYDEYDDFQKGYYLFDDERNNNYPIIENEQGTSLLSAKDLSMLNKLDKLDISNIDILKIDGFRYQAKEYKQIIDLYAKALKAIEAGNYVTERKILNEQLKSISNKRYFTGFFFKETLY